MRNEISMTRQKFSSHFPHFFFRIESKHPRRKFFQFLEFVPIQSVSKMVKVKTISRTEEEFFRARPTETPKVFKNLDPTLHKFERPKEYVRALNSTKLDKVFSKPFVGSLNGHLDTPNVICRHPSSLSVFASGGADGELKLWNASFKTNLWTTKGHKGFTKGLGILHEGDRLLSCGSDSTIKLWNIDVLSKRIATAYNTNSKLVEEEDEELDENLEALNTWTGLSPFGSLDVHVKENLFATSSGTVVQVWDVNSANPVQKYEWGNDSVTSVRWGKVQTNLIAAIAMDRSICFFDTRQDTPVKRLFLPMNSNAISWNPMQPYFFVVANEDHNLYTMDIRNTTRANVIHEDHVSTVMDVDYSPTGTEIVSGSFDQTIRIWNAFDKRSRDVYHTKRMQRIIQTKFTGDSRFILSGSDDTNIRIWKTDASSTLRVQSSKESSNQKYSEALKNRFKDAPQIKKISKHKHVPSFIHSARKLKVIMNNAAYRKKMNVLRHSDPNIVPLSREKKLVILDFDDEQKKAKRTDAEKKVKKELEKKEEEKEIKKKEQERMAIQSKLDQNKKKREKKQKKALEKKAEMKTEEESDMEE